MASRTALIPFVGLLVVLSLPSRARSQGFILDRRPHVPIARSYEVREVSVDAKVRDQVAEVQVSQTFHNPGSFELQTEYLFPLPEDGAIQNFVLMVDGRELPGRLMPKDEARRIYEDIVRSKRDPALLEYMGRGLFRTSVFPIPPGADRRVTMRYTLLCKRDRDVVEFAYPFATQKFTAKPIDRLVLNLRIESSEPIKSIYSPTSSATIDRTGGHDARVSFEQRNTIPSQDFRLLYTLAGGTLGATVLSHRPSASEDGYFLLLASPEVKAADARPQPKTVVFVLDRSGSMAGKKIEQARKALQFVLNNLRDDDLFNIVAYDDRVETYQPELQRYSSRTRREAERYVENIREGGATNIDAALTTALGMIQDESRPSYVLFLTDGLPTAGETRELSITEDCRKANRKRSRVFVFGVGFDVNARLLDRLSGGNSGTSEYVKPDEDIETHVGRFYAKMTSPVLTEIRIALDETDVNRTYPRDIPDLFEGGQLVWSGRYRQGGRTTIRVSGKVGGERRSFEFPTTLATDDRDPSYDFVGRIWAMRRVGDIIDQIDLNGRNSELVDELVALSTKFGILTPYTSFLADERVPLHALHQLQERTRLSLERLDVVSGASGVAQRSAKARYRDAVRPESGFAFAPEAALAARPAGAPALEPSTPGLRGAGGFAGGLAGGRVDRNATNRLADGSSEFKVGITVADAEGNEKVVTSVRQVGAKTFYFKNDRWVDSAVTAEDESKATVIAQFSDAFFRLARSQKAELNQYLAFTEPVTVKLDGTVYRFEPARP